MSRSYRYFHHRIRCVFQATVLLAMLLTLTLGTLTPARASDLIFSFTGTINSITDPDGLFNGYVANGDPVTGSFRYSIPPTTTSVFSSDFKIFESNGSQYGMQLTAGSTPFTPFVDFFPALWILVNNNNSLTNGDIINYYTPYAVSPIPATYNEDSTGYEYARIGISFIDPTQTAITSANQPTAVPNFAAFSQIQGYIDLINPDFGSAASATFRINSFTQVQPSPAAPEPNSLALSLPLLGVAILLRMRRK